MSGRAPFPVERTMLVSGMLEACLTSRVEGYARLETPQLHVGYQPPTDSRNTRGSRKSGTTTFPEAAAASGKGVKR